MNINRGDIWYIGNGYPAVGSEQRPGRPAVVVSNQRNNQYGEVVEVVYLTTAPKRDLPTHVTIRSSGRVSTALCEQISTVSVERLGSYCGHVSDSELTAIENAMLISLGIQLAPVSEESEEVVSIAGEKGRCGATARSSRRVSEGARHRKRLPAWHRSGGTKCDASGV